MPSQIATKPSGGPREPKRQRGRLRVAAIMEAGREVLREKGYDAATMTEIAVRSGTAIGSLYRFFPSKESLADALLQQYVQLASAGIAALAARSEDMTPDELVSALVDCLLALQSERSFALVLVDALGWKNELKLKFREAMCLGIAGIVRKIVPRLSRARAEAMALLLIHVPKAVASAADADAATRRLLVEEIRQLIRLYLLSAQ
jgi:AcrR family transcriptional regulator